VQAFGLSLSLTLAHIIFSLLTQTQNHQPNTMSDTTDQLYWGNIDNIEPVPLFRELTAEEEQKEEEKLCLLFETECYLGLQAEMEDSDCADEGEDLADPSGAEGTKAAVIVADLSESDLQGLDEDSDSVAAPPIVSPSATSAETEENSDSVDFPFDDSDGEEEPVGAAGKPMSCHNGTLCYGRFLQYTEYSISIALTHSPSLPVTALSPEKKTGGVVGVPRANDQGGISSKSDAIGDYTSFRVKGGSKSTTKKAMTQSGASTHTKQKGVGATKRDYSEVSEAHFMELTAEQAKELLYFVVKAEWTRDGLVQPTCMIDALVQIIIYTMKCPWRPAKVKISLSRAREATKPIGQEARRSVRGLQMWLKEEASTEFELDCQFTATRISGRELVNRDYLGMFQLPRGSYFANFVWTDSEGKKETHTLTLLIDDVGGYVVDNTPWAPVFRFEKANWPKLTKNHQKVKLKEQIIQPFLRLLMGIASDDAQVGLAGVYRVKNVEEMDQETGTP
jgi:hypothetical protein